MKYLKGLSDSEAARLDTLRMIHEISKGMAYLHKEGVLHGDLKVRVPQSWTDSIGLTWTDATSGRERTS